MQSTTKTEAVERAERVGAAFNAGRIAGLRSTPAGQNPHDIHAEPEQYAEWERGRNSAEAQLRSRDIAARARVALCHYRVGVECNCGGRGYCLDVA